MLGQVLICSEQETSTESWDPSTVGCVIPIIFATLLNGLTGKGWVTLVSLSFYLLSVCF